MSSVTRRSLLIASAACAATARAQTFPERPVTLVVPYSVGVGPDVVARTLAAQLQPRWGQPVVVDNRPGAAGIVAFSQVRRTPADGHTLFVADTATLAVNPLLHDHLPYDPVADLVPLTLLFQATFLLFTSTRGRFSTLAALLDAARRSPTEVRYAALGHGHPSQLAVELMAREAGVRMEPVHFKDAGTLMAAVAGAQVDFTAIGMNTVAGLVAAGQLRPLAVGARQRLAAHPEVPTIAEAGGPAVAMHPWTALVTRSGTPAPLIARLQADLAAALASPALRQAAAQAGFEITPSSPEGLLERVRADRARYEPLVREGRVPRVA
jgi:tripartite-type tricarboxylate transporter receptor subunit TctC